MQEAGTGFASKPQTDDAEPGDIALDSWVRYDDPEVRTFKLNAERQNGRAAMLGVSGCLIHELLGVDALYPTGGLGGAAPPTIVAALAVQGQQRAVTVAAEMVGRASPIEMFEEGDIGVLPPLGVYDPLGLIETKDMRRYEVMEIKHGRAAMLAFTHVIHVEAGVRFPGYLSGSAELKFSDVPSGLFASLDAVPKLGWLQILAVALACETGYAGRAFGVVAQESDREAGDIGGSGWVRYDDPEVRAFKLNIERQNGRAAMLGITGCLVHELLGVDALFPIGGMDGAAPEPIIDAETAFANFPSFANLAVLGSEVEPAKATTRSGSVQMFSEGDIGVLPPLGVYDPLGLIETRDMRRYEIMEIKHGRAAMLGFLHVIAIE